ncbi:MAG: hypothetical protein LQ346_001709 [Caloplaca aetnensis]|nr:MAG: hypothetical protein LQ346_001709 [Caloplaca aetnensis]
MTSSSSSSSSTTGGYPDPEDETHCPACDKQFTFAEARRLHYQYSDCKSLYCPLCRISFRTPASVNDHRWSVHGPPSLFCSGCATWYADVDEERWKHMGRCFGGAGFGFGGAQAGGGAKEGKGFKEEAEEEKEKERSKDEKKEQKRSESGKKGDQWSQARSSSEGPRKQKQSSNSHYHNHTRKQEEKEQQGSEDRSDSAGNQSLEPPSDLYERLRVHPLSSNTQIAHAAKKKRIEVHPDRLRKPGMTERELQEIDEIAKDVGYAADVLQDADKRRKYDKERREHNQQTMRSRY